MPNPLTPHQAGAEAGVGPGKSTLLRWWLVPIPLLTIALIGQMDKMAIQVVMANRRFLEDLHVVGRPAVTGLFMTGFLASYAVCTFLWGYVVKRFGPRNSAIAGIIMWGLTLFLSAIAQTAGAMIVARTILGVGEAFMFPVFNTFIANWFPVKERARAGSFWYNGFPLSSVVGGVFVVSIIAAGGWRMVFFALAALSILLPLPLVIFLMRDHPHQHFLVSDAEAKFIGEGALAKTKEVPKAESIKKSEDYLRNYRFWLVTATWALNNIYFWGWTTWMPTYFHQERHFSFDAAGYLYSLSFLFVLFSIWAVSYVSDRVMRRAPFGAAGWILGGIFMYLGGSVINNAYWAVVVLIITLCCQQPCFLMIHSVLQSIVPERSIAAASGIAGGVSYVVSFGAPALLGLLLQYSGFHAVILILALSSILPGILFLFLVREGY